MLEFTATVLAPKLEEVRAALVERDDLLSVWTRVFDYADPSGLDDLLVRAVRDRCVEASEWCATRCVKREAGEDACWTCFLESICRWEEAHPRGIDAVVLIDDVIGELTR